MPRLDWWLRSFGEIIMFRRDAVYNRAGIGPRSAKQESLSDSLFSPPQGYKEEKFMSGRGGSK